MAFSPSSATPGELRAFTTITRSRSIASSTAISAFVGLCGTGVFGIGYSDGCNHCSCGTHHYLNRNTRAPHLLFVESQPHDQRYQSKRLSGRPLTPSAGFENSTWFSAYTPDLKPSVAPAM